MTNEEIASKKEAMLFCHKVAQLSKALWKSVEKDWQTWIKPYDFNINEHHILWIAYQLHGTSISEIAKFGVMHVSTAFNFSKNLERRGYLTFSKKEDDKRNTYVELTPKGEEVLLQTLKDFNPSNYAIYNSVQPIQELFHKYPQFDQLMLMIRHIYGDDFMEIFDTTFANFEREYQETTAK